MIQLDTETASNQNIYAAAVTVLTHTLPASPVEHLVAANIQVSLLAASVSRALTIRLLADAQEVFKADVLFTSVTATADKVRWLAVPPLPLRGGQVITITVQSDHASDTAVTLTAYLASHDLDYILAFRAAEASPTADSPIERLKALDDGTAVVGAKLADVAHGGAAATITLATPIAATVPNTQKVDVETIKTKAVAVDAGGTTFAGTVASPTNITAATGIVLANAAHGGAAATIQLATPVEANAVQISGDAAAADALETVLDGTGGAVLKAAQLKLSCNIDGQGALDCRNANVHGDGQRNEGGEAGLRNTGASVGTLNIGVLQGERNYGTAGQGQYNLGCGGGGDGIGQVNEGNNVGQKNFGSSEAGQKNLSGSGPGLHNFGPTAQKNEAAGVTPKALQFVGAVDLIDGILADTLALDTRLPTIPASQGDVTTAHATTDGKVDAAKASADAAKASADQAARPSDVTMAHATTDGKVDAAKASADAAKASADAAARPLDVTTAHATTDGKVDAAKASADAAKASADEATRPSDVTTAHATTDSKVDAVAAQVDVKTSTRATPADVRTTVIPGTLQVRAGAFTLQGASQQTLDLPAGYASTLPLRLVDDQDEPVDLSEADLVLRAVKADGEDLFVLTEGDGITKTEAEDGQFTIAISADQAAAGRHKYELGDSGSETLYAKGDLVFRATFGLEAPS